MSTSQSPHQIPIHRERTNKMQFQSFTSTTYASPLFTFSFDSSICWDVGLGWFELLGHRSSGVRSSDWVGSSRRVVRLSWVVSPSRWVVLPNHQVGSSRRIIRLGWVVSPRHRFISPSHWVVGRVVLPGWVVSPSRWVVSSRRVVRSGWVVSLSCLVVAGSSSRRVIGS